MNRGAARQKLSENGGDGLLLLTILSAMVKRIGMATRVSVILACHQQRAEGVNAMC